MIFFYLRKTDFFGENTGFHDTGIRYRFESSKFGSAVKSYIYFIKITLIVLKEDFGLFSGPVPTDKSLTLRLAAWPLRGHTALSNFLEDI